MLALGQLPSNAGTAWSDGVVGPRYSQSEGPIRLMEEAPGKTFKLVLGGTGGSGGPSFSGGDVVDSRRQDYQRQKDVRLDSDMQRDDVYLSDFFQYYCVPVGRLFKVSTW